MDTIVTGKKGSGKTYYAVHRISKLPPEEQKKVLHNIDGLKLGKTFYEYAKEKGITFLDIWKNSYHESTDDLHGFLFVYDECQHEFDTYFKDKEVLKFFQMSRHYNIDVILLSQDYKLICPKISVHAELQLRAVPDTVNPVPGCFVYREMSGFEEVDRQTIRKQKKIFSLYKSANYSKGSERKKKRPMMRMALFGVVLSVFAVFLLFRFFGGFGDSDKQDSTSLSSSDSSLFSRPEPPQHQSQFSNDTSDNQYPVSISEKLDGIPLPLSVFQDHTGVYALLLGVPYAFDNFPFQIVKTRFGYVALVTQDVYTAYLDSKKDQQLVNYDPNQGYYWQGGGDSVSQLSNDNPL